MIDRTSEIRPCPVCGASDRVLEVIAAPEWLDRGHPVPEVDYPYYRCRACRTVYLGALPAAEVYAAYYEAPGYHFHGRKPDARRPDRLSRFWQTYLRVMRPVAVRRPGRHLDFGCGPGDYLAFARSYGWETLGVEYSDSSAETARQRGFEVVLESQLDDLPDESFDLITMNHSLEHVLEPVAILERLARKLKPGGTLSVEVPCLDCWEYRLFGGYYAMISAPLHLQFFTDETMRTLGERIGAPLGRIQNNSWMVAFFTLSFLNWLRGVCGMSIGRHLRTLICAAMFPLTVAPSLLTSALGFHNIARRYCFVKSL